MKNEYYDKTSGWEKTRRMNIARSLSALVTLLKPPNRTSPTHRVSRECHHGNPPVDENTRTERKKNQECAQQVVLTFVAFFNWDTSPEPNLNALLEMETL